MKPYLERKEERIQRLRDRASRRASEAHAALSRANTIASVIPLGQPILLNHHSEKRHRRDLARIDSAMRTSVDSSKEAEELSRRADAAEDNDAISSDDPEAVVKLREQLAKLEKLRDQFKEINATIRTAQRRATKEGVPWQPIAIRALGDMGIPDGTSAKLVAPDFAGRIGMPAFELTNLGASIRRVEKRIGELVARAAKAPAAPETYGSVRIEEAENRVRLYFPDKPTESVRAALKSNGFRWSPSEGAWQRHASNGAWYHARQIALLVAERDLPAVKP